MTVPTAAWTVLTSGAVPVASVVSANVSPGVQGSRQTTSPPMARVSFRLSFKLPTNRNGLEPVPVDRWLIHPSAEVVNCVALGFAAYLNIQPDHGCIEVGSIVRCRAGNQRGDTGDASCPS